MRQFIKELLSGKSDTSSKRFAALFTLMNLLVLTYMAAMQSHGIAPEFMFNGLLMIVGGGLGLSVVEKIFNKNKTPEVTAVVGETKPEPAPAEEPVKEEEKPADPETPIEENKEDEPKDGD